MSGRLLVVGEALVEIMRPEPGLPLDAPGPFRGPFPSGAPAIVADAAARAGVEVALVATVGDDPFGRLLLKRLSESVTEMTGQEPRDATGDTGDTASAADFGDLMVARISPESGVREGEKIQLAVEADKIHIFDPESEEAIF
jgi:pfkB family carbohydrate kinase